MSKYVERLGMRGIHVTVLVSGRNAGTREVALTADIVRCPGGTRRLPKSAISVAKSVIHSRADVVHVFTGSSTFLGVFSLILARLVGATTVMSIFGREDLEFPGRVSGTLFRVSTALAESIDVNSAATGSLLPNRVKNKTHVLLGAAEEYATEPSNPRSSSPRILFVGRLVARKGVDDLLAAFAIIEARLPEARLVIVGDGPERGQLESLTARLGVSQKVSFRGTLVGKMLENAYQDSTVFVLPSKDVASDPANEGLGLALIEASMHSKPLVGTLHGGIPEVIKDGQNGILVPPANPEVLAQAIISVLTDEDRARAMGEAALRIARDRFSWDRATDVLLESYSHRSPAGLQHFGEKVESPRNRRVQRAPER